jgi:hypothetical protein
MENMLALIPRDDLVRINLGNVECVLTSQFLRLAISPIALNRGKVKIALSARN